MKKRRLALKAQPVLKKDEDSDSERPEEVREKETLNVSDKRWRKLYGEARSKMGDIEPGEYSFVAKFGFTGRSSAAAAIVPLVCANCLHCRPTRAVIEIVVVLA